MDRYDRHEEIRSSLETSITDHRTRYDHLFLIAERFLVATAVGAFVSFRVGALTAQYLGNGLETRDYIEAVALIFIFTFAVLLLVALYNLIVEYCIYLTRRISLRLKFAHYISKNTEILISIVLGVALAAPIITSLSRWAFNFGRSAIPS